MTNQIDWVNLKSSFIADGTEAYMTIGNFFDYKHSQIITLDTIPKSKFGNSLTAYYYIDNVWLGETCENPFGDSITAPNVFTPNEDGINDVWQVYLDGNIKSAHIYNRWGNIVYAFPEEAKHQHEVIWDGHTNSGEKCSEGVYFYVLEYTNYQGDAKHLKGHVSLFR